jgi:CDP-glycerol glycerophosphotransferase (TagB/SpsB family)
MLHVGSSMRQFLRIPWGILLAIIAFFVKFVPKNNCLWVFGNAHGFIDNPQYLFEYVNYSSADIHCIWLARDTHTRDKVRKAGYSSETIKSLRGIYFAFRARVGVVANGASDINRAVGPSIFLVNLWHGTPIKKILMDCEAEKIHVPIIGKPISWLSTFIYKKSLSCVDLLPTPSEHFSKIMANAFRIPIERAPVTGYARTDVILDKKQNQNHLYDNIINIINDPNIKNIIFYAPTWRRPGVKLIDLLPQYKPTIWSNIYETYKAQLFVKYHPFTSDKDIKVYNDILIKSGATIVPSTIDVNRLLPFVSILISDYSSIVFDFALLNKPIYIIKSMSDVLHNIDGYYENIDDHINDSIVSGFNELQDIIPITINNGLLPTLATQRFASKHYTQYRDTNNCYRIFEEIKVRISL